jgi:hypothetical protein
MKKIVKYVLLLIVVGALGGWFLVFYLPKTDFYKNITAKKIAPTTAIQIVNDFIANEDSAFTKYSGKLIEVSGVVADSKIENGKSAVYLKSNDPAINVYFLLKENIGNIDTGKQIILKGMCSGYLGDVQFNEGEIIK